MVVDVGDDRSHRTVLLEFRGYGFCLKRKRNSLENFVSRIVISIEEGRRMYTVLCTPEQVGESESAEPAGM